ncbi:MAG: hypothetical protein KGP28_09105 [Bdellovibrionales bacterium]|nr:hypothetical protein [Bdellovibrionales bacterium]
MNARVLPLVGGVFIASFAQAGTLIFSGGVSPDHNFHSQYLQTRSLADGLRERLGGDRVSVAFGVGNRIGSDPILADVSRLDYGLYEGKEYRFRTFFPGFIQDNHQANRQEISRLVRKQAVHGEPLFLLISDHGSPGIDEGEPDFENNCINLWETDPKTLEKSKSESEGCYSRKNLEDDLSGISASKIIYGMSQCYSGGFHRMSVKRDDQGVIRANPNLCGFAASTPDLPASGCTDRVDGPNYAGYERFFTSQILGEDFITHEKTGFGPATNLREAHLRATNQDFTGDIPTATSDFYLFELMDSLRETRQNLNFNPEYKAGKIMQRIEFFSDPENGSRYFRKKQGFADEKLYFDALENLNRWSDAARDAGFLDVDRLISRNQNVLLKERKRNLKDALKDARVWRDADQSLFLIEIQMAVAMELESMGLNDSDAEKKLREELGIQKLFEIHGENLESMAPLIATRDPSAGHAVQLYALLKRIRPWREPKSQDKPIHTVLNDLIQKQDEANSKMEVRQGALRTRELRERLLRSLSRMRVGLGVLGAAIQTKSAKVIETYRALLECESTPLDHSISNQVVR